MGGALKRRASRQLSKDNESEEEYAGEPLEKDPNAKILRARRRSEQPAEIKKGLFKKMPIFHTYEQRVKGLNESFLQAASMAHAHNNTYDMSSLFSQYEAHKKEISMKEEERKSSVNLFQSSAASGNPFTTTIPHPITTEELNNSINTELKETMHQEPAKEEAPIQDINQNIPAHTNQKHSKHSEKPEISSHNTPHKTAEKAHPKSDDKQSQSHHKTLLFCTDAKLFVKRGKKMVGLGEYSFSIKKSEEEKTLIIYDPKKKTVFFSSPVNKASLTGVPESNEIAFIDSRSSTFYKAKFSSSENAKELLRVAGDK
ncbi:hypothetical protein NEFER03_0256 [Nematocida sp. LUAm3]|nr:hypothetical protein NEFER03_0256 [Nematocida sp. LUAm3]KAI5173709.1 hypothetical protein NEFER02_0225 [Nematocida sp. LUAm2]KAI5176931.1 hypothetical protein NEFER01_0256 [Nematocida sp. LUAm1]